MTNRPLDQRWLTFAGIDYEALRSFIATGATDDDITQWIGEHAVKRSQTEIDAWNKREGAVRIS